MAVKPLFFYPKRVNVLGQRLVSFQIFLVSLWILVFGETASKIPGESGEWWWVPAAVTLDITLRFIGFPSPTKQVSIIIVRQLREWVGGGRPSWGNTVEAGAPKQFAGFIAWVCAICATLIYNIGDKHSPNSEEGRHIVAKIFLAMLGGAAFVHAIFNFCLGCFIFHYLERAFRPRAVVASPSEAAEAVVAGGAGAAAGGDIELGSHGHSHAHSHGGHAHSHGDSFHSGTAKRPLGKESIKMRTIEQKLANPKANFSLIKHFEPDHFAMPLGISAVALMWRANHEGNFGIDNHLGAPQALWHTISYIAAVGLGIQLILLILKSAFHPDKVRRHWDNPWIFNTFGFVPITWVVLTVLLGEEIDKAAYSVLLWCGAGVQLIFAIVAVGRWFTQFRSPLVVNAGMLMGPLGLLVSAVGLSDRTKMVSPDGVFEVAALYYYTGVFFWFVLQPLILWAILTNPRGDPKFDFQHWVLLAAASVVNLAALVREDFTFALIAYFVAWFYFLVSGYCALKYVYYRIPFSWANWVVLFPLGAFSTAVVTYHNVDEQRLVLNATHFDYTFVTDFIQLVSYAVLHVPGVHPPAHSPHFDYFITPRPATAAHFTAYLAWFACGITSFVAVWLFIRTVVNIGKMELYVPIEKWGPISITKLSHKAMLPAAKKCAALAKQLSGDATDEEKSKALFALRTLFTDFLVTYEEHSKYEEDIVFPHFNFIFPGVADQSGAREEHHQDHLFVDALSAKLTRLFTTETFDRAAARQELQADFDTFITKLEKHFNTEELHLQSVGRKYWSLEMQVHISKKIWENTPLHKWRVILPFVINNLPLPTARARFVRALIWANPVYLQAIGKILYENTTDDVWLPLANSIPGLTPRTVEGYELVKAERNTRPTQRVAGLAKTPLFLLRFSLFPIFVMAVKPLFFYPKRVNVLGQRLVSFQIFLVSLWILVFGETASKIPGESGEWWWVPAAVTLDITLRFIGFPSPTKQVSIIIVRQLREWVGGGRPSWGSTVEAGAPKQFAGFIAWVCGICATLIYNIGDKHSPNSEEGRHIVAKIFLAMLGGAAFVHAIFNFCLGCFIFHYLERAFRPRAAVPADAVEGVVAGGAGAAAGGDIEAGSHGHSHAHGGHAHSHGGSFHSGTAKRPLGKESMKMRTIEQKLANPKANFSLIKHFEPDHFAMPLGISAVALMWRANNLGAADGVDNHLGAPQALWHTIGYIAVVTLGIQLILLIVKSAFHPDKVRRHWDNPWIFNTFGFVPIVWIVLTVLLGEEIDKAAYSVLIWCGAGVQLIFAIVAVGRWFTQFRSPLVVNAGMLVPVLGLMVSSIGMDDRTKMVSPDGVFEVAALWYYTGVFFWFVLQPLILWAILTNPRGDPKMDFQHWILLAAAAVVNLASLARQEYTFALIAYFVAWFYFLVLSYVSLKYLYYRIPFGWHNWGLLFPLGAFSTAVVTYHNVDEQRLVLNATHFDYTFVTDFIQLVSYAVLHVPGVRPPAHSPHFDNFITPRPPTAAHFTAYLAWFACGITSFVAAWLFIRTVVSIGKMEVYVPIEKWGPSSITKLSHKAMLPAAKKCAALAKQLSGDATDEEKSKALFALRTLFTDFLVTYEEHSKFEEEIVFPHFNFVFPGIADQSGAREEHHQDHLFVEALSAKLTHLFSSETFDRAAVRLELQADFETFVTKLEKHFNTEELHLQSVGRKYWSLELQVHITKKIWEITPLHKWRVILPFVVNNLPLPMARARFVRALIWGNPVYAQTIGKILYENTTDDVWLPLANSIPGLIPRTVEGYERVF